MQSFPSLTVLAWDQMMQNPRRALEISLQALEAVQDSREDQQKIDGHLNVAWSHFYLSEQSDALNHFLIALDVSSKARLDGFTLKAKIGLGAVYQQLSRFDIALENLTSAYQLAKEIGDSLGEIQAGIRIGEVHLALGKPQQALEFFFQAQSIAQNTNQKPLLAEILLSLGQTYLAQRRNEQALEELSRALVLTKELNNRIGEARALTGIGQIYRDISELEISEEYHLESLKICQQVDHKWGQLEAYYNLGDLHLLRGHKDVAYKYYEKVIALSAFLDSKLYTSKTYQRLAEFWERGGDFRKALDYTRHAFELERDLKAAETTQKVHSLNTQLEFEKSRAQGEILRLKSETLEKESAELQKALDRLKVISELGRRITSCLKAGQLVQTVYDSLVKLLDVPAFGLALYNAKEKTIRYPYRIENDRRIESFGPIPIHESLTGWTILNKKTLLIQNVFEEAPNYLSADKAQDFLKNVAFSSMIFLPLFGERDIVGALTIQHPKKNQYTLEHCQFLETLGGFVTVALRNMLNHSKIGRLNHALQGEKVELEKANQQIKHMAHHDLLTGLANRRLLTDFMAKTISYSQRHERRFAVYFLDLDGFKPVNDTLGHDAGDWVLSQLGYKLSQVLRESDIVARVGGDEFVAIALEVEDRDQSIVVAGKLCKAIQEPLLWEGSTIQLGVSVGISLYPDDGTDVETLLNKADDAMYVVKRSTKNGWSFFASAVPVPKP